MRVAYLDCFSGLSGDMFLGALVDAGLSASDLEAAVAKLPVQGYSLSFARVRRGALAATRVKVEVTEPQPARRSRDIFALLEESRLPPSVVAKAKAVFARLVAAEAKVHGVAPEEAHLHEVGAVDALVDVVGTVVGLELLGIEQLWVSPLPCPRGWVATAHGKLPLPAPAVLELLQGVPIYEVDEETELVTSTGVALAVALAAGFGPLPPLRLERVGYGAGERKLTYPNVLRLLIGEAQAAQAPQPAPAFLRSETVAVMEADIDDMSGESCSYLAERLRQKGALDGCFAPVQMKKDEKGNGLYCDSVAETWLRMVADLMALAAHTAPKAYGKDFVVTRVLGRREVVELGNAMISYGARSAKPHFARDGQSVRQSSAMLLVGLKGATALGLNCGACGHNQCDELVRKEGPEFCGGICSWRLVDLGIAVGSAVKMASLLNADNRVMYRAGVVARQIGMLDADVVLGIPLSATGKNIYFDRSGY